MSARTMVASGGARWVGAHSHITDDFVLRECVIEALAGIKSAGVSSKAAANWVNQIYQASRPCGDFLKWSADTARDLHKHGWDIFDFEEESQ